MKRIELSQSKFTLVNDEDFEYLSQWRWYFGARGAAIRTQYLGGGRKNQRRKMIYMHRLILNVVDGLEVDHINHDPLDNRRQNLRICTRSQNLYNTRRNVKNTSGYKGVHYDKKRKRWVAQISINNKIRYLGGFMAIEDAANTYKMAAIDIRGEFAWI